MVKVVTSREFNHYPNQILSVGEYVVTKRGAPIYKIVVTTLDKMPKIVTTMDVTTNNVVTNPIQNVTTKKPKNVVTTDVVTSNVTTMKRSILLNNDESKLCKKPACVKLAVVDGCCEEHKEG